MKTLILVVLMLSPAALAVAQTPSSQNGAPGVSVAEWRWSRQSLPSPALFEDPLQVAEEQARLDDARSAVIQQNKRRAQAGVQQAPVPTNNGMSGGGTGRRRNPYQYVYEVKFSNTGEKKILRVYWEYTFTDSADGAVAGQHQFTHEVSLRPGRSKKLVGRSNLPPTRVVNAARGGQESTSGYLEQVSIRRVEFEDGTAWEAPPPQSPE